MSETEDDDDDASGMALLRRKRRRGKLQKAMQTADAGEQGRDAASAWGDMLAGEAGPVVRVTRGAVAGSPAASASPGAGVVKRRRSATSDDATPSPAEDTPPDERDAANPSGARWILAVSVAMLVAVAGVVLGFLL